MRSATTFGFPTLSAPKLHSKTFTILSTLQLEDSWATCLNWTTLLSTQSSGFTIGEYYRQSPIHILPFQPLKLVVGVFHC